MSILGLSDPWIIAAYAGCFITVILCCWVGIMGRGRKGYEKEKDEDEEEDSE
ncbi:MAG: hypothetical protein ACOX8X_03840 [Methanomethylophilus sp.]|jgi:hypothetical protein